MWSRVGVGVGGLVECGLDRGESQFFDLDGERCGLDQTDSLQLAAHAGRGVAKVDLAFQYLGMEGPRSAFGLSIASVLWLCGM